MIFRETYQRLGANNLDVNTLLHRYKLAKYLVAVSLLVVIVMALGPFLSEEHVVLNHNIPQADVIKNTSCVLLTADQLMPPSPDGSYTPPAPDATLLRAVDRASQEDYNRFCESWDPVTGFPDRMTYNEDGDCGTWQTDYMQLHELRLEQLERLKAGDFESFVHQEHPGYVSYLCKEDPTNRASRSCGGLADRMSGMVSIFLFALLTDRAYLAHWQDGNPIPLEVLFEKPHIDWSYDPDELRELFDKKNHRFLSYQPLNTLNEHWGPIGRLMFPDGPAQDFNNLWNASYIEWRSNRAFVIRTFQESSIYPERLARMGLHKENAFRCIMDFLFRPTIGSRQFINAYKAMFEMKSILSIGLQIRTGDSGIVDPNRDNNTILKWNYFFNCANDLREAKREPHHKQVVYFLVTDSANLRDEFVSMNDDREKRRQYLGENSDDVTMVVTGLPIEHVESKTIKHKYIHDDNEEQNTNRDQLTAGVNAAVIENWLLSYTDYRLISRQGFGKLAAFHSKSAHTTIAMPLLERQNHAVNCANPHAFITFDTLSTWWSLG